MSLEVKKRGCLMFWLGMKMCTVSNIVLNKMDKLKPSCWEITVLITVLLNRLKCNNASKLEFTWIQTIWKIIMSRLSMFLLLVTWNSLHILESLQKAGLLWCACSVKLRHLAVKLDLKCNYSLFLHSYGPCISKHINWNFSCNGALLSKTLPALPTIRCTLLITP